MEKLSYNLDFEDSKYFLLKGFLILAPHYAVKNSFSPFFKSVLIVYGIQYVSGKIYHSSRWSIMLKSSSVCLFLKFAFINFNCWIKPVQKDSGSEFFLLKLSLYVSDSLCRFYIVPSVF